MAGLPMGERFNEDFSSVGTQPLAAYRQLGDFARMVAGRLKGRSAAVWGLGSLVVCYVLGIFGVDSGRCIIRALDSALRRCRMLVLATLWGGTWEDGLEYLLYSLCLVGILTAVLAVLQGRYLVSAAAHLLNRPGSVRYDHYRDIFGRVPLVEPRPVEHHTHGDAAACRTVAIKFLEHFAHMAGCEYYSYQCSAQDVRRGNAGSRVWYWHKDVAVPPQPEPLWYGPGKLLGLIDVDYYMEDLPHFLAQVSSPVAFYTFIPDKVCGEGPGYSFTFDEHSRLCMAVSGGATYSHRLWNYGPDCVHVKSKWWWLPFIGQSRAYLIDRRRVSANRYVVLFTPIGTWGPLGTLLTTAFKSNSLQRLRVTHGEFMVLAVQQLSGLFMSLARVGTYTDCTVTMRQFDTVATLARVARHNMGIPTAQGVVDSKEAAAILVDYFSSVEHVKPDYVFPTEHGVRRYQMFSKDFNPMAKPSMVPFMSPLVNGCYSPDQTLGSEKWAVSERITKVRSTATVDARLHEYMHEFVVACIPDGVANTAHPHDYDDVYDRQARPIQRRLLDEASFGWSLPRVFKTFLKKEAYGNVKAPRPITTYNSLDKLKFSRYTYTALAHMKKMSWYAFGKVPRLIASIVAYICTLASWIVCTDFSKFDGHVSQVLRTLEQLFMMRLFMQCYHAELLDLMRAQYGKKAYTSGPDTGNQGVSYDLGYARGSGSPETSGSNTLGNAFVNFVAFRLMGYSAVEAYRRLGIYGGDDGLTADVDPKQLALAAKLCGQEITVEKVQRGQLGVKFLARMYSRNVWSGDDSSCSDIMRQMSKVHATPHMGPRVTPAMKLVEKCSAYVLTDANTPILGQLARSVVRAAILDKQKRQGLSVFAQIERVSQDLVSARQWVSQFDSSDQYPNNNEANWMEEIVARDMGDFDRKRFEIYLERCCTVEDHLCAPLCLEGPVPESKQPVVVDGMVWLPTKTTEVKRCDEPYSPKESPPPLRPENRAAPKRRLPNSAARASKWAKTRGGDTSVPGLRRGAPNPDRFAY
jgi:hypothetical protein